MDLSLPAAVPSQLAPEEATRPKKRNAPRPLQPQVDHGQILERPWVTVAPSAENNSTLRVKIKTWNLLAQTLVRRELFPVSDCLKATQREHMIVRELLEPRADILCLQEVDRLEKIIPVLEGAGYDTVYASGPAKKHGCLIAFDPNIYEKIAESVVKYDEQEVRETAADEHTRRGSSIRTTNIGSIIALKSKDAPDEGFIVATTHLFWHPRYIYERVRQTGILLREVSRVRQETGHSSWPCLLAGDFNFAPDDAAYALLVGAPLLPTHEQALATSRVVHVSIDPSVPLSDVGPFSEDDSANASVHRDRKITNSRAATDADGLLNTPELVALFAAHGPVTSAYDTGMRAHAAGTTFGTRVGLPQGRKGYHEPEWTSYTYFWKTVLDYIFVLDPPGAVVTVTGFLQPPSTLELDPGIPRKGVSGSDHTSMVAELSWSEIKESRV